MDDVSRNSYEVYFERDFLKKKGNEFQNFFCEIMELRYPEDFMRTRPGGRVGDQKNDGYLPSRRMLFQIYAPNNIKAKETIKKISEDFNGAKVFWEKYFDTWVFAHNCMEGLPPEVNKVLLDLKSAAPPDVVWWGFPELRREVFQLDDLGLAKLFGLVPTQLTMLRLGYENLRPILDHLSGKVSPAFPPIRPVPPEKLAMNSLSVHVQELLLAGMQRSDMVERFFRQYPIDPSYGDQIAHAFTIKYLELKGKGLTPDQIYSELQIFAGGEVPSPPEHQAAILTILAYFFEKCDIFDRPILSNKDDIANQTSK